MPKLRFLVTATVLLAVGLLTPACGDDPTGPESVAGLYILQTVNGEALPTLVEVGISVTAGSIQLNSDGTYTRSLAVNGQQGPIMTGTFTVDGSTVDFIFGDLEGDRFTATVSGNTLTLVEDGDTFEFRK